MSSTQTVAISQVNGSDWAALNVPADQDIVQYARATIESRRAQGLGHGPYEIRVNGSVVTTVA